MTEVGVLSILFFFSFLVGVIVGARYFDFVTDGEDEK